MAKQDMQLIIEMLAKAETIRKTDKEEMLARMDANMKAWKGNADADMKTWREEICSMRFETTNTSKETIACQEM
jgi:hypothetical protein